MYARQSQAKGMRVPPNYSGSAFQNISNPTSDVVYTEPVTEPCEDTPKSQGDIPAASLSASKGDEKVGFSRLFGGASGGIGLEELLILGLALLISQNDTKDDLAFLLLLLVFIK